MNLFVYGTLLVPKIWEAVSGRSDLESIKGEIFSHQIFRVRGGDFPGIVQTEDASDSVPGKVFCDIPEQAMRRLDAYEDIFYVRREVNVFTPDGTTIPAHAYVVTENVASQILTNKPWTLAWFEENALDSYWARLFES